MVDYFSRPNPRTLTTHKMKSGMNPKNVGSSSKSLKGKQVSCYEFEFVKVEEDDVVMIYLIYFLEGLLDKLKNLCEKPYC